ncbi:hypothetical protein EV121DRAFT_279691 [Schizophyllum commune]
MLRRFRGKLQLPHQRPLRSRLASLSWRRRIDERLACFPTFLLYHHASSTCSILSAPSAARTTVGLLVFAPILWTSVTLVSCG